MKTRHWKCTLVYKYSPGMQTPSIGSLELCATVENVTAVSVVKASTSAEVNRLFTSFEEQTIVELKCTI